MAKKRVKKIEKALRAKAEEWRRHGWALVMGASQVFPASPKSYKRMETIGGLYLGLSADLLRCLDAFSPPVSARPAKDQTTQSPAV